MAQAGLQAANEHLGHAPHHFIAKIVVLFAFGTESCVIKENSLGLLHRPCIEKLVVRGEQPLAAEFTARPKGRNRGWIAGRIFAVRFQYHLASFNQMEAVGGIASVEDRFTRLVLHLHGADREHL